MKVNNKYKGLSKEKLIEIIRECQNELLKKNIIVQVNVVMHYDINKLPIEM